MDNLKHESARWLSWVITGLLMAVSLSSPGQVIAQHSSVELGTSAAFDSLGRLWVVYKNGPHVIVQSSADLGKSFDAARRVNDEPEPVAADHDSRPKVAIGKADEIYVTWTRPLGKPYTGFIRFSRSLDGGGSFSKPRTVHSNRDEITHRFDAIEVDPAGRIFIAWIDKRDVQAASANKQKYPGAAIYFAVSDDRGETFRGDFKIADYSCECCRIATARDTDGAPVLMWRHVFAPNERDHALARLKPDGTPEAVQRATFDRWKVDACPHHGPSLTVDDRGTRHAVWFNQKDGEGHVYYGRLESRSDGIAVEGQRPVGGPLAAHADLAAAGSHLAIVWKEFDGERTRLHALISSDRGVSFTPRELDATAGASDQPRVLARGDTLYVFWRTEKEGFRLHRLQ